MIKPYWEKLDHKQKRIAAVVSGLAAVGLVAYLAGGADEPPQQRVNKREAAIRSILTDKSTRDLSIDSLSATMKIVTRENEKLKKQVEIVTKQLDENKKQSVTISTFDKQLEKLNEKLADLKSINEENASAAKQTAKDLKAEEKHRLVDELVDDGIPVSTVSSSDTRVSPEVFSEMKTPEPKTNAETGERIPLKIVSHVQPVKKQKAPKEDKEELYMPAASIMTGVLLNGLDAPTGQGARRDPFPTAIRIQKEAILPNHYRADVRECFALASGYGDLSTERAFLRTETISCVREDGGVIEARLNGYIVGEDGKAGLRGRLVSKQGQIIAKSLMAGFMGGVANAFDVNPVPVINTSPGGSTQYQETMSSGLVQGAAMKGASSALDRVAKFYIEMAESMFPVVEIDAGREADIIITGGVKLKIRQ